MFKKFSCTMTRENFVEQRKILQHELEKTKITPEEIDRGQLLLEEILFRLEKNFGVENFEAKVEIIKKFGDVNLRITSKGEEYNPIIALTDYSEEDEDYFSVIILKANNDKMGYSRKNGRNIVLIRVHTSGGSQVRKTFAGLFLGMVLGFLLKEFFGPEVISFIETYLVESVRTMFLNALKMIAGLLIFFSVIAGITGMSKTADVGKIGLKLLGISVAVMAVNTLAPMALGLAFFQEPLTGLASALPPRSETDFSASNFALRDLFVGIVPDSIVAPLITGNVLQVLFLAVFFGFILNKLGEKSTMAMETIKFMNHFCMEVMLVIIKVIPLVVCLSMMMLMFHTGLDSIVTLGKFILVSAFSVLFVFFVAFVAILFFGKISPMPFVKKLLGFIAIPFSTSSSNACLPDTLTLCTDKLGINPQLSSFSIPVGIQINAAGNCFYIALPAFLMAKVFGVDVDEDFLVTVFFSAFLMAISMPTVPGVGILCLGYMLTAIGVPAGAVMIILCIDPILDMTYTVTNVVCDVTTTFLLAKSENMVDEKVYLS